MRALVSHLKLFLEAKEIGILVVLINEHNPDLYVAQTKIWTEKT